MRPAVRPWRSRMAIAFVAVGAGALACAAKAPRGAEGIGASTSGSVHAEDGVPDASPVSSAPMPADASTPADAALAEAPADASAKTDASGSGDASPPGDGGAGSPIRRVDWCNLGYPAPLPVLSRCEGSFEERHRAGEGIHSIDRYRFASVTYGELTGDGNEDALVVMSGAIHPVLIGKTPPRAIGWVALATMRGSDVMILDATPLSGEVVESVTIAHRSAVVVRRRAGDRCAARAHWDGKQLVVGPCVALPAK